MKSINSRRRRGRGDRAGSGSREKVFRVQHRFEISLIAVLTVIILLAGTVWSYARPWVKTFPAFKAALSEEVLSYESEIRSYAVSYGIEEYVPLIEAVMQQESGGRGTDVMQASESHFNERYERVPGSIDDPDYSIEVGVHYLSECLKKAQCRGPWDITRLRLALQGYNYGYGYIEWALEKDGGYTEENAKAFSEKMKKQLEWDVYGDTEYPAHVLRYYSWQNNSESLESEE